jgi:uncharacterized protein (DUF433 family)
MDYSNIITIEPGKRSGKPSIRGTRMTVTDVLEYLANGMSEQEILADFPDLTSEDIKACWRLPLIASANLLRCRNMKLLFDQNLSPHLTRLLADIYAESVHVREIGLREAESHLMLP